LGAATQNVQLVAKRYYLSFERTPRPEEVQEDPPEQIEKLEHPAFSPDSGAQTKRMEFAVDGILGLARSAGSWWLRFRLMIERGPPERPQASEEKRSHGTLCRIGCVGERDQRVYR
jgi:hypothetical protein